MDIAELFDPTAWLVPAGGPRYIQLQRRMENAIVEGLIPGGTPLPPEREIASMTGLSRVTVRNAVQPLVKGGLVVQKRGSGSVVAMPTTKVEQSMSRLTSFTEDMKRRGMNVTSRWLARGKFMPSSEEFMALGLSATESVSRLARLRMAEGIPLAIERASLPEKILPNPFDVETSLYAFLDTMDRKPVRATQRISATNLDKEDADLLGVDEGIAGLSITRLSYLESGQIVELTKSIYRGEAYDFVAELRIPKE